MTVFAVHTPPSSGRPQPAPPPPPVQQLRPRSTTAEEFRSDGTATADVKDAMQNSDLRPQRTANLAAAINTPKRPAVAVSPVVTPNSSSHRVSMTRSRSVALPDSTYANKRCMRRHICLMRPCRMAHTLASSVGTHIRYPLQSGPAPRFLITRPKADPESHVQTQGLPLRSGNTAFEGKRRGRPLAPWHSLERGGGGGKERMVLLHVWSGA